MATKKSINKKRSEAMKKRWADKKVAASKKQHFNNIAMNDVVGTTKVEPDKYVHLTEPQRPRQMFISISIHRPDGSSIRIEH